MNCTVTSANNFSGQSVVISRISLVQLGASVRKFNLNRPFICPILKLAALEKTIAYPIETSLYLSDPRFLLAFLLIALTALLDSIVKARPSASGQ